MFKTQFSKTWWMIIFILFNLKGHFNFISFFYSSRSKDHLYIQIKHKNKVLFCTIWLTFLFTVTLPKYSLFLWQFWFGYYYFQRNCPIFHVLSFPILNKNVFRRGINELKMCTEEVTEEIEALTAILEESFWN